MKIGSKYKIARRVGAPVFEKTQTQKFAIRESRRERRNFARSDYGLQLVEKQKVRYTYCITASQFSKYVKTILEKSAANPQEALFAMLERRLDNVVFRAGFAKTRLAARQMVNHGHIMVNGKRMGIPSYQVTENDVITPRMQSLAQPLFAKLDEQLTGITAPTWLSLDKEKKVVTVKGQPRLAEHEVLFNLGAAIEFHSR